MTEKEYKLLRKKILEDIKPVLKKYAKAVSKQYLKETLETLADFSYLGEIKTPAPERNENPTRASNKKIHRQHKNIDENILPDKKFTNTDKTKKIVNKKYNFGGVEYKLEDESFGIQELNDVTAFVKNDYRELMDKVDKLESKK